MAGEGGVAFVIGGPGRGKTALLDEFARQGMAAHPDLLITTGKCTALFGTGDPYLPFREALCMLTGDVASRWTAGSISRDHARRLWSALPLAVEALVERGPDVIGTLVDGTALLSRALTATRSRTAQWLDRLQDQTARHRAGDRESGQLSLFEQVTNVLLRLAGSRPVLLILDDLQWIDTTSTGLLFHLIRRLPGHRVLLVGAYRPEEVRIGHSSGLFAAQGNANEGDGPADTGAHQLRKVLAELKRQYGDVWMDLSQPDPDRDRAFIEAYLDAEPNRLGREFREHLYTRTAGHPLFTVELLRAMQERHDLRRDEGNRWVEGPSLRWESLPARAEGAIEQRIERLAPDLRDILTVASVEGEEFTAQAVAGVVGGDKENVLCSLAEGLTRTHRLVRPLDELPVGNRRLSRFQFRHALIRDYVYNVLTAGEQRLLHHRVGRTLEKLYGDHVGEIAATLMHHYAGDPELERRYARVAGERAAATYANEEAARFFDAALALTPEDRLGERHDLLLSLEKVHNLLADRQAQERDMATLEQLARDQGDERAQAETALRQAWHAWQTDDHHAALAHAQRAASLGASVGDPRIEAHAHRLWGVGLSTKGDSQAALRHFRRGLTLAQVAGDRRLEAEILRQTSWVQMDLDDIAAASASLEASLQIFREVGNQHDELQVAHALSGLYLDKLNYGEALGHAKRALRLSREIGARLHKSAALGHVGWMLCICGAYERAGDHFKQMLHGSRGLGRPFAEAYALSGVGYVRHAMGHSREALPSMRKALSLARQTGVQDLTAQTLAFLGVLQIALGQHAEAAEAFNDALELCRELGQARSAVGAEAGLARVALARGDLDQAMCHVESILGHLETGTPEPPEVLHPYLVCYRVLTAAGDDRADGILDDGYRLLMRIADSIPDPELRRSFLERVAHNHDLCHTYATVFQRNGLPHRKGDVDSA